MDVSYGTYDVLEQSLRDIISLLKPSARDQEIRVNIIDNIATCLGSVNTLKGSTVKAFGSFVSNLYSKDGDLDLFVQSRNSSIDSISKNWKKRLLRDIRKALRMKGVAYQIEFIPHARVPLLKFKSTYCSISCDVSIGNHSGLLKSKMLLWISNIDSRFRDMVFLTKEWAKAKNINDPKLGTLNSFSLCLLIIFHFQTCEPAILPPMKEIYDGNLSVDITDSSFISVRNLEDLCAANIRRFESQNYGKKNRSSLSQLLISFFQKFSNIKNLSSQYAICTHTGRWESLNSSPRWSLKSHHILVEDPFEHADNAARSVGPNQLIKISNDFQEAFQRLSSTNILSNRKSLLECLTRPSTRLQLELRSRPHFDAYGGNTSSQITSHRIVQNDLHQFQNVLKLDEHHPISSAGGLRRIIDTQRQQQQQQQEQQMWRPRFT